jgi:hypothetical protein
MWHLWYLVGAGGGLCAAACIIYRSARRLGREGTREARTCMLMSIFGSLLMMPMAGIIVAAAAYMATP